MSKTIGKIFEQPAVKKAETPPQVLRCAICGKEYKTEKGLADHMAEKHPPDITPDQEADTENESETTV